MLRRALIAVPACLCTVVLGTAVLAAQAAPSSADRDAGPTLKDPRVGANVTVYRGRTAPGARVRIARRTETGWTRFASTRADAEGRYRAKAATPDSTWKVRAAAGDRHSPIRTVTPPSAGPTEPTPTPTEPTPTDPTTSATPTATPTDPTTSATPTATPTDPTTSATPTATPTDPTTSATPTDPTTSATPTPTDPTTSAAPETDACGVRPEKADGTLWSCTFDDDFDGTALDTSTWLVQETAYSGMTTGGQACYVNQPDTIAVSGGSLHLSAHRNLAPFTCKSPYGDFTTTSTAATVATRNSFTQTYGRFEFRAKFPDIAGTPGAHSALWLYPRTLTYGAWPASGEIDVAEWFSALPGNAYPSVHYLGEQAPQSTGLDCAVASAGTKYHTYGVEWTPTEMRFFYDGTLCWVHSWTPDGMTAPQPFDKPFYLVLTQAFGALWNAPTSATPDGITMDVDWARAWK